MERLVDKVIVILCCLLTLASSPIQNTVLVAFLLAVTASALYDVMPARIRPLFPLAYCAACLFIPSMAVFLPLPAYDCMREERVWIHPLWAIAALPLLVGVTVFTAAVLISCGIACLISWRTTSIALERDTYRRSSDDFRERALSLEARNRDLRESGDMQARLVMLSERGRIAREIHDNVGHLLTRGIMQVEALQVTHAADAAVKAEFADVGSTLHAAMDEMRASVHDLHDESLDVRGTIEDALAGSGIARTHLDYQVTMMPVDVGYCFIAIVREALSNTVRHSDATQVDVHVVEHPGIFQLSVHDNGSAAAEGHIDDRGDKGMGLISMEDRVRSLGGTLRTERKDGFRVFASIPRPVRDGRGTS